MFALVKQRANGPCQAFLTVNVGSAIAESGFMPRGSLTRGRDGGPLIRD